eukprot:TRINITY_DN1963_c1_g1_i1.p1 TRINITY_DN1963_c1_g1~~TRINITY_DN1963_c1_g1_i1.p1  ORF type:complete len:101 (-),score=29.60 TRINITY_DN1963_c1_g1_i1:158-460(-)
MIYDLIETSENKRRQQDFQSRNYLPNGTKVRRGRDWDNGNIDGHGDGVVIRPCPYSGGGAFYVRWNNNGNEGIYCFGYNYEFHVRIISLSPPTPNAKNIE